MSQNRERKSGLETLPVCQPWLKIFMLYTKHAVFNIIMSGYFNQKNHISITGKHVQTYVILVLH